MRRRRLVWLTAAALGVAGFTPVPAQADVATPPRGIGPADAATVVARVLTDVNGDAIRDTVTLSYLGSSRFELSATTTKGKTSKVRFTSYVQASTVPPKSTWYGASAMDGRLGSELIVNRFTKASAAGDTSTTLGVYTWRSGRLVAEKAPSTPTGRGWVVNDQQTSLARGYRFFTQAGHRYAEATRLVRGSRRWTGKTVRSVWRGNGWVQVATRASATKGASLTSWSQVGIAGPKLLLSQVSTDVDGDGQSDLVGFYRNGLTNHVVTVTSANGSAQSSFPALTSRPFLGATEVDGVAGSELLFETDSETRAGKVLTWRNGRLVDLAPPILYGGYDASWGGRSEDALVNYAFSSDSDGHYAVSALSVGSDGGISYAKSIWNDDHWESIKSWVEDSPAQAQYKAIRPVFTADGLVRP